MADAAVLRAMLCALFLFAYGAADENVSKVKWLKVAATTTYREAKAKCEAINGGLCMSTAICKHGQPAGGKKAGDQWVAIADSYNDWMQVGNGHWPACQAHTQIAGGIHGRPGWGTNPAPFAGRTNLACCPRACSCRGGKSPKGWDCPKPPAWRFKHCPACDSCTSCNEGLVLVEGMCVPQCFSGGVSQSQRELGCLWAMRHDGRAYKLSTGAIVPGATKSEQLNAQQCAKKAYVGIKYHELLHAAACSKCLKPTYENYKRARATLVHQSSFDGGPGIHMGMLCTACQYPSFFQRLGIQPTVGRCASIHEIGVGHTKSLTPMLTKGNAASRWDNSYPKLTSKFGTMMHGTTNVPWTDASTNYATANMCWGTKEVECLPKKHTTSKPLHHGNATLTQAVRDEFHKNPSGITCAVKKRVRCMAVCQAVYPGYKYPDASQCRAVGGEIKASVYDGISHLFTLTAAEVIPKYVGKPVTQLVTHRAGIREKAQMIEGFKRAQGAWCCFKNCSKLFDLTPARAWVNSNAADVSRNALAGRLCEDDATVM